MYHDFSLQDKNWDICDSIKSRIEQFKRTMPLIQDLKNPAMRDRHWAQIKSEVQKPFDQNGKLINLITYFFFSSPRNGAILNRVSKVIRNCFGFDLIFSVIGQSNEKLETIATWSCAFSRASSSFLVFTLSSHWLMRM